MASVLTSSRHSLSAFLVMWLSRPKRNTAVSDANPMPNSATPWALSPMWSRPGLTYKELQVLTSKMCLPRPMRW